MYRRMLLSVALVSLCAAVADAGPFRRRAVSTTATYESSARTATSVCANGVCVTIASETATRQTVTVGSTSALDEVNAKRAARGLKPYIFDPLLTIAAERAASERASRLVRGHLANDFVYLPAGATANAAGCGALEPSWGWGACCTFENWTYAGAAAVPGRDGRIYYHLFVR